MSTHTETAVVDVPVRVAYDQWTQFESYPAFMDHVESVQQLTDDRNHWNVQIMGVSREYDAQILRQEPDQVIAWRSTEGPEQAGEVMFEPVAADQTKVTLQLRFEPDDAAENIGDALGFVSRATRKSLDQFKEFIENRGDATGQWRGEVPAPGVVRGE